MNKIILIVVALANTINVSAESSGENNVRGKQSTKIDCQEVFSEVVQKMEANYLGYKKMELTNELDTYNNLKIQISSHLKNIETEQCAENINKFTDYFKDGHLSVIEYPNHDASILKTHKEKIKQNLLSYDSLVKEIEAFKVVDEIDHIVGEYVDGVSEIAVIKEGDKKYNAYILSSTKEGITPGELKVKLTHDGKNYLGTYYSYGYQPRFVRGVLFKEKTIINFGAGALWAKTTSSFKREVNMINKSNPQLPTITKIDDENVLFSIPTFSTPYKEFMNVLKENAKILKKAKNLIIDVRGNRGGNAVYFNFIGIYATTKIMPASSQGEVLASEDTKEYYQRMSQNSKEIFGSMVTAIEKNMGAIIPGPKYVDKKIKIQRSNIQNVAILTDGATGSAAESFILHSKSTSNKVKTFGSPTYGMIDNTSVNSVTLKSSKNQNLLFVYPTSSMGGTNDSRHPNGYNEKGILPDVAIDEMVEDKVQFIMDYYKK